MQHSGKRDYHTVTLQQAREQNPPVSPVEAMRRQLQLALFDAVSEADVAGCVKLLKQKALDGDLKAMKMLFELVVGRQDSGSRTVQAVIMPPAAAPQAATPVPTEIAMLPPLPAEPTAARPQTAEKIDVLAARASRGEELFHPADARNGEGD